MDACHLPSEARCAVGWEPVADRLGESAFHGRHAWRMDSPYAVGDIVLGTGDMVVSVTGPRRTTQQLVRA